MQSQRERHILRMCACLYLRHGPRPRYLERAVVKLAFVVVPHPLILPDHTTGVDLLVNCLICVVGCFLTGAYLACVFACPSVEHRDGFAQR